MILKFDFRYNPLLSKSTNFTSIKLQPKHRCLVEGPPLKGFSCLCVRSRKLPVLH